MLASCATPAPSDRAVHQYDAVGAFLTAPFWDKQQIAPVIELIRQGAIAAAADTLFNAGQITPDPAHSRLLRDLLIGLGRWEDLRTMVGPNPAAAEMLRVLAQQPPEEFVFQHSRSVARLGYSTAFTPTVEVEIDGTKHRFWLDTGTGTSVLGSELAAQLGIKPITPLKAAVHTVTDRLIEAAPAVIPRLRVGDLEVRNHHVLIIETKELQVESLWGLFRLFRIEGILGWNFIQHADLEIDMRTQQLTLRRPGKLHRSGRNLLWLGWPYVITRGPDGRVVVLGLDTGAGRTFVTRELTDSSGVPIVAYRETTIEGVGGVSLQIVGIAARVQLELDGEGLTFDSVAVHPFTLETLLRPQGVLGADILSAGKLRLDWADGKVTYQPYQRRKVLPRTPVPIN